MRDDDVVRRLTVALRSSRDPDVEAIVVRARDAAVAEAGSVLEAVITRSILERAADYLASDPGHAPAAPPSPERARGREPEWIWYVYGIQRADTALPVSVDGVVA